MNNYKRIGISDFFVTTSPIRLRTIGIGSCIALIFFDKHNKIGGMSHIMLPNSPKDTSNIDYKKYCDTNIYLFYKEMINSGANKHHLQAAVFGGAQMFPLRNNPLLKIGEKNIETTFSVLNELNIPVIFKDTGGEKGRSIEFDVNTGEIELRTVYEQEKTLKF